MKVSAAAKKVSPTASKYLAEQENRLGPVAVPNGQNPPGQLIKLKNAWNEATPETRIEFMAWASHQPECTAYQVEVIKALEVSVTRLNNKNKKLGQSLDDCEKAQRKIAK